MNWFDPTSLKLKIRQILSRKEKSRSRIGNIML